MKRQARNSKKKAVVLKHVVIVEALPVCQKGGQSVPLASTR